MVASTVVGPLVGALVSGSVGTTPVFFDGDGVTLTRRDPAEALGVGGRSVGVVYDAMSQVGDNFESTTGLGGQIGAGYTSTITSPSTLAEFEFFGGVGTDGHVLFFDFFGADFSHAGSFGVGLPAAGNFIWTITLSDPTAMGLPGVGLVSMVGAAGFFNGDGMPTVGSWLYTDAAPAVGTTAGDVYRMRLTVIPGSGVMAMTWVVGLAACRRRRRC